MIKTGIIRGLDDSGRVVLPKDIRKMCGLKENDFVELFTDRKHNIILKKYNPIIKRRIDSEIK